jgi:hypothetical protein
VTADQREIALRCPVLRRALLLVIAISIPACASYYPEPVNGLTDQQAWLALPMRRWLAEDRAEPEALAICRRPDCASGMVVGVLRTRGKDADEAEAVLRAPERLAKALEDMRGRKSKVRTAASVRRLKTGTLHGFVLALGRSDGERPAYGAALGTRTGDSLRIVMAIGEDPNAVEATARRVASEHLGS